MLNSIFYSGAYAAGRPESSCDRIGENADMKDLPFMLRMFSSRCRPASGMSKKAKATALISRGSRFFLLGFCSA